MTIGLTPHAPYSVAIDAYRRCVQVARDQKLPLATHLAEAPDEAVVRALAQSAHPVEFVESNQRDEESDES